MLLHLLPHHPDLDPGGRDRRRPLLPHLRPLPPGVPPRLLPRPQTQRHRSRRRGLPGRGHVRARRGEEPQRQDDVALLTEPIHGFSGERRPESGVDEGGGVHGEGEGRDGAEGGDEREGAGVEREAEEKD